jgi:hypothetical protein
MSLRSRLNSWQRRVIERICLRQTKPQLQLFLNLLKLRRTEACATADELDRRDSVDALRVEASSIETWNTHRHLITRTAQRRCVVHHRH